MIQKNIIYLTLSILFGCIASGNLKETSGFTNFFPSLISTLAVILCIFFLAKVMVYMPMGIAYATYSAVLITVITLIGFFIYKQIPNYYTILGFCFIVIGISLIHTIGSKNFLS